MADGRTWTALLGGQRDDTDQGLFGVWFADGRNGLVLRQDGGLRFTDDGGRSWIRREFDEPSFSNGQSLQAADDGTLWLLAGGQLRGSTDAGRTWSRVNLPLAPDLYIDAVQLIDRETGWIYTQRCKVDGNVIFCVPATYLTRDGGRTLSEVGSLVASSSLQFADDKLGVVKSFDDHLARTTDGGKTWTPAVVDQPLYGDANRIYFRTKSDVWILPRYGDAVALRSLDGGQSWRTIRLPTGSTLLYDITFADERNGWMVGLGGLVLATRDGGATWSRQFTGTERGLFKVFAVDASTAWIVGSQGTLLVTATGGR